MRPRHLASGARRRSGCDAIIDDDGASIAEIEPRPVAPVLSGAPLQLDTLPTFDRVDVDDVEAGGSQHLLVDDTHPSLADGSHGELRLEGHPQFAHDDDVERGAESLRHLEGHGHPAARKAEHHDIAVPDLGTLHDLGQLAARIHPIAEPHGDLLHVTCSVPPTHRSRQSRWSS